LVEVHKKDRWPSAFSQTTDNPLIPTKGFQPGRGTCDFCARESSVSANATAIWQGRFPPHHNFNLPAIKLPYDVHKNNQFPRTGVGKYPEFDRDAGLTSRGVFRIPMSPSLWPKPEPTCDAFVIIFTLISWAQGVSYV
jgi:hypothetical protein